MQTGALKIIADTQVREPPGVRHALDTIRRGVSAMGHRAQGTGSSVSLISPENLLAGTCLRYDTSDRGALGAEELRQVHTTKRADGICIPPPCLQWGGGLGAEKRGGSQRAARKANAFQKTLRG